MDERDGREEELESRQTPGLYPIGRALRATYDAENHESLGNDLTGLMLALARVDDAPSAPAPTPAPQPFIAAPPPPARPIGLWQRLAARLWARSAGAG